MTPALARHDAAAPEARPPTLFAAPHRRPRARRAGGRGGARRVLARRATAARQRRRSHDARRTGARLRRSEPRPLGRRRQDAGRRRGDRRQAGEPPRADRSAAAGARPGARAGRRRAPTRRRRLPARLDHDGGRGRSRQSARLLVAGHGLRPGVPKPRRRAAVGAARAQRPPAGRPLGDLPRRPLRTVAIEALRCSTRRVRATSAISPPSPTPTFPSPPARSARRSCSPRRARPRPSSSG